MSFFHLRISIVISVCLLLLQFSMNCAEPVRSRADRDSRSPRRLVNFRRVVRNDPSIVNEEKRDENGADSPEVFSEPLPFIPITEDIPLVEQGTVDDSKSTIIQDQISPFILAATDVELVEQPSFSSGGDIFSGPSETVELGTQSFLDIQEVSVPISEEGEITQNVEDPSIDLRIVAQAPVDPETESEVEPFPTILVNPPPQIPTEAPEPSVAPLAPSDLPAYPPVSSPATAAPLPEPVIPSLSSVSFPEKVEISSSAEVDHSSAEMVKLQEPTSVADLPLSPPSPVKIDSNPPSALQSLTQHSDKNSLYKVLPPFYGIFSLYTVAPPTSSNSSGTQVQDNQPKNRPATSYGPPSSSYGPPASSYGPPASSYGPPASSYGAPRPPFPPQGNNYPRRPFGFPPTPRALGFPPITNTRDNMRHEVNWARVGRAYRSV